MNKYQKMKSSISSDKKPHPPSHPLKAILAKTTTTILSHNFKVKTAAVMFRY